MMTPIIKVKVLDQMKYSRLKENIGNGKTYWGEHFFINKVIEDKSEIENQKLHIEVLDKNKVLKDSVIGKLVILCGECSVGSFNIDLMVIYLTESRAIQHRWVALTNPAKGLDKVLGYLKLSVSVLGEGDAQIALEEEKLKEGAEMSIEQLNIMFPPQVKLKGHQVIVTVFKGEQLKKMDTIGSVDPYVQIRYGDLKQKTKVVKNNQNPVWFQQIFVYFEGVAVCDFDVMSRYRWHCQRWLIRLKVHCLIMMKLGRMR